MIKISDNGGLASLVEPVTQKVLISDTTLKLFIPPQVRKMSHKLRQICGCELCIITKDMYIGLNVFRKIFVTYLQQNYFRRHTHNSLFSTTSVSHNKDKVFPYGEFLHATIKDGT